MWVSQLMSHVTLNASAKTIFSVVLISIFNDLKQLEKKGKPENDCMFYY